MPDAYDRLLLDVFYGSQLNFVRRYDIKMFNAKNKYTIDFKESFW